MKGLCSEFWMAIKYFLVVVKEIYFVVVYWETWMVGRTGVFVILGEYREISIQER